MRALAKPLFFFFLFTFIFHLGEIWSERSLFSLEIPWGISYLFFNSFFFYLIFFFLLRHFSFFFYRGFLFSRFLLCISFFSFFSFSYSTVFRCVRGGPWQFVWQVGDRHFDCLGMHQAGLGNFVCGVGGVSLWLIKFYFWDWACVGRVVGIWLSGLGDLFFWLGIVVVVSWSSGLLQGCSGDV